MVTEKDPRQERGSSVGDEEKENRVPGVFLPFSPFGERLMDRFF